jgi:putative membrane protein
MSYLEDPRVYFAAERTMLAWVRTGIAAMGLGLVTAKFGIFLRFMAHVTAQGASQVAKENAGQVIGVAITLMGTGICLMAAIQFRTFVATLRPQELPPRQLIGASSASSFAFSAMGLIMSIYLLW